MEEKKRDIKNSRELGEFELNGIAGGTGNESDGNQGFLEKFASWSAEEIKDTLNDLQRGDITGSRSERNALEGLLSGKDNPKTDDYRKA